MDTRAVQIAAFETAVLNTAQYVRRCEARQREADEALAKARADYRYMFEQLERMKRGYVEANF